MRQWTTYLLRLLLFWLATFAAYRIMMLVAFRGYIPDGGVGMWFPSLTTGSRLDISAASFFAAVPMLCGSLSLMVARPWLLRLLRHIANAGTLAWIGFDLLLQVGELSIYGEWRGKATARYLYYLTEAGQGVKSATMFHFSLLFVGLLILVLQYAAYRRWLRAPVLEARKPNLRSVGRATIWLWAMTLLCVIGVRGNLGPVPLSASIAYTRPDPFLNDVACNSPWNFATSLLETFRYAGDNRFMAMEPARAASVVEGLFRYEGDSVTSLLREPRPNIVIVLQEGMSADMVGALGGHRGFTPQYDALAQESYVFDRLYSSGWNSEVGHFSVFTGFPALPDANPILQPEKYRELPSVVTSLREAGYHVGYYYGGKANYGNIRGYMYDKGCEWVKDEDQWPDDPSRGSLGFHDGYMFRQLSAAIGRSAAPWCNILFTLSTHTPHDIPTTVAVGYRGEQERYARAVYYADSCMGEFVAGLKASGEWEHTLLLVIPDHSLNSVIARRHLEHERYRIGWLVGGGAVKPEFRGKRNSILGSQLDFAGTLLPQLGLDAGAYRWSKNLLREGCPQFATYVYQNGHGWMRPWGSYVFDYQLQVPYEEEFPEPARRDSVVLEGKAFIQAAQQAYLDLGK